MVQKSKVGQQMTTEKSLSKAAAEVIASLFGPASEQIGIMFEDWAKYWRVHNVLKVSEKLQALEAKHGVRRGAAVIPPRIGIPALQHLADEDDEQLQSLWANLLYRALDPDVGSRPNRTLVNVLKEVEPTDVKVLLCLDCSGWDSILGHMTLESIGREADIERDQLMMSIQNLFRLNLIDQGVVRKDENERGTNVYRLAYLGRVLLRVTDGDDVEVE